MRIYRMCATFGKLENQTLTLQPGFNVIEAPNEWGKSTWCAFLLAMLYGLDTRAKTTKTALADKERYAPWSGSPMSGRIDLNWQGRDITIERQTRGRVPLGVFRAYETDTGLEIPELTAANCGQLLLGAERSVFRRAGFIRQSDMPVTRDEALRTRLNDLVTTGDESGDAQRLEKQLREQKNRIRYNRTGRLPQLEERLRELEEKTAELESLENQEKRIKQRLGEGKTWLRALENHQSALRFAAAEADARKIARAEEVRDQAEAILSRAESACAGLPPREDARQKLAAIRTFQHRWNDLAMEQGLPQIQELPGDIPEVFRTIPIETLPSLVASDRARYAQLKKAGGWPVLAAVGIGLLILAAVSGFGKKFLPMALCLGAGLALTVAGLAIRAARNREREALTEKYGYLPVERWRSELERYLLARSAYEQEAEKRRIRSRELELRLRELEQQRQELLGTGTPEQALAYWQQVIDRWDARADALRDLAAAQNHLGTLRSMVRPVPPPAMEDSLTYSPADTAALIADAREEQQRLTERLGQYRGRIEALGDSRQMYAELEELNRKIGRLEEIYSALELALETLNRAQQELQRRFAPRIANRAQELLCRLTYGRYDRLKLQEDLSVLAAAEEETVLHEAIWRSDGTMDQLYLALRLAVAEELTPAAPLVLDDAFARFDDRRLTAALEILKEMAENKQVLLFTCQHRETEYLQ